MNKKPNWILQILLFSFSKMSLTPSFKVAILLKQKISCPLWIIASAVLPEKGAIIDANRMSLKNKIYRSLHFNQPFFCEVLQ